MSEAAADHREVHASPVDEPAQFPLVSRWLHWVMAGLVVVMLFIGAGMMTSLGDYRFLVSVHKPLGVGVLALAVIRLVYRFTHRAPPPPRSLGRTERRAALASESLLYGLMVAQPLVGWAMVSASDTPFVLGGAHLPAIVPADPGLYSALRETHTVFGYALFLLFSMHMLAVLAHALVLRDGLLTRMALWRFPGSRPAGSPAQITACPQKPEKGSTDDVYPHDITDRMLVTIEEWRAQHAQDRDSADGATPDADNNGMPSQPRSRPEREPASRDQVRAAEARLGVPLPPSLWAFLLVSNGFGPVSQYTEALRSCEEIDWFRRTHPAFVDSRRDTEEHDLFRHSLCLTRGADAILLDTRTVSADGEYGAYLFAVKYGELDQRYGSFGEVVLAGRAEIEWHRQHCV